LGTATVIAGTNRAEGRRAAITVAVLSFNIPASFEEIGIYGSE
jgi:hypothetical protein